ncbi:hypothetical protein B296_00058535 [Ensete ventricosum]|uniref:SBP-type domain-containing protein n=1 Tax=Ensete ventricosum TaxID=4639 RepID=A0A426XH54_ENSVE|nr:hypothetical protein B296_00058535 [Ensete ventricosum]
MNRFSSAGAFVPSMTSFAGMEGSSQKHYTWNWETNSHNLQNHAFFPCTPLLDCPPTLVPANGFHFFSPPPPPPEYPMGLVKRDDGGSGCGRIGLNLGHRTYFLSGDAPAVDRLLARSRGMHSLSSHQPRCKAEGCKTDLSGAKHYHRRHKVCEIHSKATVVAVGGLQQRFCQQCSRTPIPYLYLLRRLNDELQVTAMAFLLGRSLKLDASWLGNHSNSVDLPCKPCLGNGREFL